MLRCSSAGVICGVQTGAFRLECSDLSSNQRRSGFCFSPSSASSLLINRSRQVEPTGCTLWSSVCGGASESPDGGVERRQGLTKFKWLCGLHGTYSGNSAFGGSVCVSIICVFYGKEILNSVRSSNPWGLWVVAWKRGAWRTLCLACQWAGKGLNPGAETGPEGEHSGL